MNQGLLIITIYDISTYYQLLFYDTRREIVHLGRSLGTLMH
jgi:hypothetical protein